MIDLIIKMEVEQTNTDVERPVNKRKYKKFYPKRKKIEQSISAEPDVPVEQNVLPENEGRPEKRGLVRKNKKQFYFGRKKNARFLNRRYRQLTLNHLDFPGSLRLQFEISYDKILRNGEKRNGGKAFIDIFDILPIKYNALEKMNEYLMVENAKKEKIFRDVDLSTIDIKDLPRVEFRYLESIRIVPFMMETEFEGTDELQYQMRSTYLLDKERYFLNKKGILRLSRNCNEDGSVLENVAFSKDIKVQFVDFTYDYLNELINSFEAVFRFH